MNSKPEISLLYDFYGELLKNSQQQVVELYVNEDLSLSEVAEILSISRQGVRDSLRRAEQKLSEYEHKLGLLRAYREQEQRRDRLHALIRQIREATNDEAVTEPLDEIEDLLRGDD